jgi:hypothetical protein
MSQAYTLVVVIQEQSILVHKELETEFDVSEGLRQEDCERGIIF